MVTNNETLTKIAQYTNLVFCYHTLFLTLSLSHAYSTFSSLYFFYAFSLCWIRLCLSLALSHSLSLCMFVFFFFLKILVTPYTFLQPPKSFLEHILAGKKKCGHSSVHTSLTHSRKLTQRKKEKNIIEKRRNTQVPQTSNNAHTYIRNHTRANRVDALISVRLTW